MPILDLLVFPCKCSFTGSVYSTKISQKTILFDSGQILKFTNTSRGEEGFLDLAVDRGLRNELLEPVL